ncbi:MAG: hypothetical protein MUO89_07305 [Dehalococcoidia bacterium]|nr:hypothetical protein [Dehalococcoidia bacterium]
MTKETGKVVTVLMVMSLVLGLALVACTPTEIVTPAAPSEQPATQPPAETPATQPPAETPAAQPPAETPATTPPAAKQLTYEAKTYTNSEYGFSVQYPKDWVERTDLVNKIVVAAFSISGFIPGMSISVADASAPLTADWIVAQTNSLPETSDGKVTSDITPTTLDDGSPAFQYTLKYNFQTFEIVAFGVAADKDGKRIRAFVWTIDAFSPYDETLFSEIAHTLSLK